MILRKWLTAAALSASFVLGAVLPATAADKKTEKKPEFTFGALRTASPETAKALAADWLKSTGKMDQKALDAIWANDDATVLDRMAETFKIGSADAAKLLAESGNAENVPPKAVPALLEDVKQNSFFRANLALAYGRDLINARVYEEGWKALTLKGVAPELVVDPSAYFFNKAVAEHALAMSLPGFSKEQASKTIIRLLDDVADAPDRYRMVATIMFFDMQMWKKDEKDLSNIVKLMDNSERRLDLGRGGKITQDIQKRIVFRLDELIKEKEQQSKSGQCNGGNCPGGGKPGAGGSQPSSPMQDSNIATNGGPGNVLEQKIKNYQENWGKLPEAERARAIQELTRDLPPRYRLVIEDYFKTLNKSAQTP